MKFENFEGKIKTALLNFLWPGFGYYFNEQNKRGLDIMTGYFVLVFITMIPNSPGWLILPFLVNIATVVHPIVYQKGSIKTRDKDRVLEDYTRKTLLDISKRIDRIYQRYIDIKAKMGDYNKDIQLLSHHLSSLKKHYNLSRESLVSKDYTRATDEATFSYKLIYNIEKDMERLERKYIEFSVLK